MIDVLLINPPYVYAKDGSYIPNKEVWKPLGILYLATLIEKKGFSVKVLDLMPKEINLKETIGLIKREKGLGLIFFRSLWLAISIIHGHIFYLVYHYQSGTGEYPYFLEFASKHLFSQDKINHFLQAESFFLITELSEVLFLLFLIIIGLHI